MQTEISDVAQKKRIFTVIIVILLALSIVANAILLLMYIDKRREAQELRNVYAEEYFVFDSATVDSFKERVVSGDEFVVFISRPNCSSCQLISEDFMTLCGELGIERQVLFVNVVYLRRDNEAWASFKERYGLTGTPSFVRFADGEVVSALSWTEADGAPIHMIERWILEQDDFFDFK